MKRIEVTRDEILEGNNGACIECGAFADGVEPDARYLECEECGAKQVYGLEELLMMGQLDLIEEGYDDD